MTTTSHTRVAQTGAAVNRAPAAPPPRAGAKPTCHQPLQVRGPAPTERTARTARVGANRVHLGRHSATRIGVDLVDTERFVRLLELRGSDVRDRVFTTQELHECRGAAERLAARFAAKEAAAKALSTGIGPIGWRDVEVRTGPRGEPTIRLHGGAAALAYRLGLTHWAVSLSHDAGRAVAVVVAARGGNTRTDARAIRAHAVALMAAEGAVA